MSKTNYTMEDLEKLEKLLKGKFSSRKVKGGANYSIEEVPYKAYKRISGGKSQKAIDNQQRQQFMAMAETMPKRGGKSQKAIDTVRRQQFMAMAEAMPKKGGMSEKRKKKMKQFFKDFSVGFKKGFSKTMELGLPLLKSVIPGIGIINEEDYGGAKGKPKRFRKLTQTEMNRLKKIYQFTDELKKYRKVYVPEDFNIKKYQIPSKLDYIPESIKEPVPSDNMTEQEYFQPSVEQPTEELASDAIGELPSEIVDEVPAVENSGQGIVKPPKSIPNLTYMLGKIMNKGGKLPSNVKRMYDLLQKVFKINKGGYFGERVEKKVKKIFTDYTTKRMKKRQQGGKINKRKMIANIKKIYKVVKPLAIDAITKYKESKAKGGKINLKKIFGKIDKAYKVVSPIAKQLAQNYKKAGVQSSPLMVGDKIRALISKKGGLTTNQYKTLMNNITGMRNKIDNIDDAIDESINSPAQAKSILSKARKDARNIYTTLNKNNVILDEDFKKKSTKKKGPKKEVPRELKLWSSFIKENMREDETYRQAMKRLKGSDEWLEYKENN